jgi:hypothetical protein
VVKEGVEHVLCSFKTMIETIELSETDLSMHVLHHLHLLMALMSLQLKDLVMQRKDCIPFNRELQICMGHNVAFAHLELSWHCVCIFVFNWRLVEFVWFSDAFLRNHPNPTSEQLEEALDGNLCRCTGYRPLLDASKSFAVDAPRCGMGEACCKNSGSGGCSSNSEEKSVPNEKVFVQTTTADKVRFRLLRPFPFVEV